MALRISRVPSHVPSDPRANTRAAVLAASLSFEPQPVTIRELQVPAIRRVVPRQKPPLNLDAAIYRYRIERVDSDSADQPSSRHRFAANRADPPFTARLDAQHRVVVIDGPAGGRFCRTAERRHRR